VQLVLRAQWQEPFHERFRYRVNQTDLVLKASWDIVFFKREWPTVLVQIIADLNRPRKIHEPKYSERDKKQKYKNGKNGKGKAPTNHNRLVSLGIMYRTDRKKVSKRRSNNKPRHEERGCDDGTDWWVSKQRLLYSLSDQPHQPWKRRGIRQEI